MTGSVRRIVLAIVTCASLVTLFSEPGRVVHRVLYNPTESAPRGWYWLSPARDVTVHEFVVAHLPMPAGKLADERGYLPATVPILKRVGAVAGQFVCETDGRLSICGAVVAMALSRDTRGRALTPWSGCRVLSARQYFLLSQSNPASFDSRYFGPIEDQDVLGEAVPLWTW
jgi:conjugative transfer signal peptidase TraF